MSLWCFIVCFSLTCCLVSGQVAIYKLVGEKVDFLGFSKEEAPTDILWKHIEGDNVHKVVHFDGSEEKSFGSFEGRVTLNWHSANLSISNLRYEDSGFYDLEMLINQLKTKRYGLMVIDNVTKPTISCEINNASTSESAGNATLLCSLPSHSDQSLPEFQWSTNGQINPGHVLKISLGGELDDHQYNCTVKNRLTQESAVFTAKDCYPAPKAQAGLIAGVVVVVVLLLIPLLLLFIYRKKVCSNHEKSDLESHSNPEYSKVAASGSEETQALLDRAPTVPSKQTLGHLKQRNDSLLDPPHKDVAHMKELRESIRQRSSSVQKATENTNPEVIKKNGLDDPADSGNPNEVSNDQSLSEKPEGSGFSSPAVSPHHVHSCSDDERPGYEEKHPDILDKEDCPVDADETKDASPGSENSEDEGNKASQPPAVPQKSNLVRNFSALKKATENTNPKVIKKKDLDDPADSGNPNEVSNDQSLSEKPEGSGFSSPPAVSPHLDHPCSDDERPGYKEKCPDILENNPVDADETKDALSGSENNEDEGNKASQPPAVPQKSNLVQNFSALKKATENTNPKVKRPASNDSSDSGNQEEVPENQNSGTKKEENEFEKSTPENDVQPPPVARESSPLSQNSPESSPEAEHKQDINSDECAKASNGESSSSQKSEIEEQAPPASTAKDTDSETTVSKAF